jgi:hypothetical protein
MYSFIDCSVSGLSEQANNNSHNPAKPDRTTDHRDFEKTVFSTAVAIGLFLLYPR